VHDARTLQNTIYKLCSEDKDVLFKEIYSNVTPPAATPAQAAAAAATRALEDTAVNASGASITANFANNLAALANNPLISGAMKSEKEELGISEIDLKSVKHAPTKDTQKIKVDRVINSLLPEVEEFEPDVY
jgi:hypothetical protein